MNMTHAGWRDIELRLGHETAETLARDNFEATRAYVADLSAALNLRRRRMLWGYAAIVVAAGLWGAWMGLCIPY